LISIPIPFLILIPGFSSSCLLLLLIFCQLPPILLLGGGSAHGMMSMAGALERSAQRVRTISFVMIFFPVCLGYGM
jgi:hypothetical protein